MTTSVLHPAAVRQPLVLTIAVVVAALVAAASGALLMLRPATGVHGSAQDVQRPRREPK